MNALKLLTIPAFGLLLLCNTSCGNKSAETSSTEQFEIKLGFDTINIVDSKGRKQGIWLVFKDSLTTKTEICDTVVYKNDTAYSVTASTIKEVVDNLNRK